MNGILAFSDAASLALHTAGLLAAEPKRLRSVPEMAEMLGASQAHLAKVLQSLARAGLVRSVRGPGGGFQLARSPREMTLLEVYEAVSGTLRPSTCLLRRPVCTAGGCVLGDLLRRVQTDVREYLSGTKVAALAALRFEGDPPTPDDGAPVQDPGHLRGERAKGGNLCSAGSANKRREGKVVRDNTACAARTPEPPRSRIC
ncbi:MAG: Rrf2 family transcriptional regulator [Myxococcales bacterium]|nr:Rrf2 family transcriptional regulator [Myxococcales bacterium]